MTTIPYLTPRVVAALRKQNDMDGKGGWKAKIGVDDVALLLDAAEALPALTERVKAAEREAARLRKGMLEVPPKIATAMGDEVTKLRAELAAIRTLHTDKIIAFDALAAKVARVEAAICRCSHFPTGGAYHSVPCPLFGSDHPATLTEGTEGS